MTARTERLFTAIRDERLDNVLKEIEQGADINGLDEWHDTPLHEAAKHRYNSKIALTLIEHGANVNGRNSKAETPLHMARSPLIVELLLSKGAGVDYRDKKGRTPLHAAIEQGMLLSAKMDIVSLLLEAGADPDAVDYYKKNVEMRIEEKNYSFLKDILNAHRK